MRSPVLRIALTIVLPLLLVFAGDHVLLPGMEELLGVVVRRGAWFAPDRAHVSVLALGITPMILAYGAVELAAFLGKKWSRLRHGNPEGRLRLERAARLVALVLGALQAWGVAQQITLLDKTPSSLFSTGVDVPSSGTVVATLVGGLCLQIVVAEIISRQGIANGYVLLAVVEAVAALRGSFGVSLQNALVLGTIEPKHVVLFVLVVVLPAAATWIVLRGAGRDRPAAGAAAQGAGPYRAARAMAVSPWVPVPSSSIMPYALAIVLLGVPYTLLSLLGLARSADGLWDAMAKPRVAIVLQVVLTGALAVGFARLLHRPREMAVLASRLGFEGGEEATSKAAAALSATRVPTLLFFATVLFAAAASQILPARLTVTFVPLLVALAMDMGANLRASTRVAVWQERRASAVPVVRAVLTAEGIDATVRGMSVLSLLQAFAPYAPAEIMVAEADASRASAILRHVFLGEKRPEAEPRDVEDPSDDVTVPWAPSRRNVALAITTAAALAALGLACVRTTPHEIAKGPPPRLEVVHVDDESDVMGTLREQDLPSAIELRFENVPVGPGRTMKSHFARTTMAQGETYEAAFRRMRAWSDGLALPVGRRIGLEAIEDYDDDAGKLVRSGVRTFVLVGEPILRTEDVVEAMPSVDDTSPIPGVSVAITLSPDAGERFRIATRDSVQRRIGIIVNEEISSVPVVKSEIGGGRLSITMGSGELDVQLANAKKLARALHPDGQR